MSEIVVHDRILYGVHYIPQNRCVCIVRTRTSGRVYLLRLWSERRLLFLRFCLGGWIFFERSGRFGDNLYRHLKSVTFRDWGPLNSGKKVETLEYFSFFWNRSILLRKRIIEVRANHFELHICSNTIKDSFILFYISCVIGNGYSVGVFFQDFIVSWNSDEKDTSGYIFKAMYPFPSFWSLSANIANPMSSTPIRGRYTCTTIDLIERPFLWSP